MKLFLWLVWATLALVIHFVASAVIHTIIAKFRELPPKRQPRPETNGLAPARRLTYSAAKDRERSDWQR